MILNTMTPEDTLARVKAIVCDVETKEIGLSKKYAKQLKDRKVADNSIVGITRYTIDGGNVYVVTSKQQFGRGKRNAELVSTIYISCLCPSNGKISYIKPTFDLMGYRVIGYSVFTTHCINRLKERAGEDFIDFLRKYGHLPMSVKQEGGKDNYEGKIFGCPHKFFGYRYGDINYITTMVTEDMCFEHQIEIAKELEEFSMEYIEYKNSLCA